MRILRVLLYLIFLVSVCFSQAPIIHSEFTGEMPPGEIEFGIEVLASGLHTVIVAPETADSVCESLHPDGAVWTRTYLTEGAHLVSVDCGGLSGACRFWAVREPSGGGPPFEYSEDCRIINFCSAPESPALVSPLSSTEFLTFPVELEWTGSVGAEQYRIQYSSDTWFSDYEEAVVSGTNYEFPELAWHALGEPLNIYWRVSAGNYLCGFGVNSSSRYFTIPVDTTVDAPSLRYPGHHSYICDPTPLIMWYQVTGADYYRLAIDNDSTFISPVYESEGLTGDRVYIPTVLGNGTYYWKMYSHNPRGWSEESSAREFNLGDEYITVTTPPTIEVGSSYAIRWSRCGSSNVDILYSTDSGSSWLDIVTNESNDGYYLWQPIDNTPSENCRIIIRSVHSSPADTSGVFAIVPGRIYHELAALYSPIIIHHPDEEFFPFNADRFWENSSNVSYSGGVYRECDYGNTRGGASVLRESYPDDARVYYRAGESFSNVWLQYYIYYPYADYDESSLSHFSDWEVISLYFSGTNIEGLTASPAPPDYIGVSTQYFRTVAGSGEFTTDGNHPVLYAAKGTHSLAFSTTSTDTAVHYPSVMGTDLAITTSFVLREIFESIFIHDWCFPMYCEEDASLIAHSSAGGVLCKIFDSSIGTISSYNDKIIEGLLAGGMLVDECIPRAELLNNYTGLLLTSVTNDIYSAEGDTFLCTSSDSNYTLEFINNTEWNSANVIWGNPIANENFPVKSPVTPYYSGFRYDDPILWSYNINVLDEYTPELFYVKIENISGVFANHVSVQDSFGRTAGHDNTTVHSYSFLPGVWSTSSEIIMSNYGLRLVNGGVFGLRIISSGVGGEIRITNSYGDTLTQSISSVPGDINFFELDCNINGMSLSITPIVEWETDIVEPYLNVSPSDMDTVTSSELLFANIDDTLSRLDMHTCNILVDSIARTFFYNFDSQRVHPRVGGLDIGWHTIDVAINDYNLQADTITQTFYWDTIPPPDCSGLFTLLIGGSSDDYGYQIYSTIDSGYICSGISDSPHGSGGLDVLIYKLDNEFQQVWGYLYGGIADDGLIPDEFTESAMDFALLSDGGYAFVTSSVSYGDTSALITKLTSDGSVLWSRTITTGDDITYGVSLCEVKNGIGLPTGEIMLCGNCYLSGDRHIFITKFSSIGSEMYTHIMDRSGQSATDIISTSDGGFFITGQTSYHDSDFLALKLDSLGEYEYMRAIGSAPIDDEAFAVAACENLEGDVIVTGWIEGYGAGGCDIFVTQLNSSGFPDWRKTVGFAGDDYPRGVSVFPDSTIVVTGTETVMFDRLGNNIWSQPACAWSGDGYGNCVLPQNDKGFLVIGSCDDLGDRDIFITKIDSLGLACATGFDMPSIMDIAPDFNFSLQTANAVVPSMGLITPTQNTIPDDFEYYCSCDTTYPNVDIDCPVNPLKVTSNWLFEWTRTDDFLSSAPCSLYLSAPGIDLDTVIYGTSYNWSPPLPATACTLIVLARDIFFNWGGDTCIFTIEEPCWAEITDLWVSEEILCDDVNSIEICYDLYTSCSDSTFNIEVEIFTDSLTDWNVPMNSLLNDVGHIGAGVSGSGVHCFNWIMSDDWFGDEGNMWYITAGVDEEYAPMSYSIGGDSSIILDSSPPNLVISGNSRVYVWVGSGYTINWSSSEMFPSGDGYEMQILKCTGDTILEFRDSITTYRYNVSIEDGLCDTIKFIISQRDSFCSVGADTLNLVPRSSLAAEFFAVTETDFQPLSIYDGFTFSCDTPPIYVDYSTHCEIDTISSYISVDGSYDYYLTDSNFVLTDTILIFNPLSGIFTEGEHSIALHLVDNCGNVVNITRDIVFDFQSPVFGDHFPHSVIDTFGMGIENTWITFTDNITGFGGISISVISDCAGYLFNMDDITILGDTIFMPFVECEDSINYCIRLWDNPDICTPNEDTLCFSYIIKGILHAPELLEPIDLNGDSLVISSCENQSIRWKLNYTQPIVDASIYIQVDGITYVYPENMTITGDTLTFASDSLLYGDGDTVEFCFRYITDISGTVWDSVSCWAYVVDMSPPEIELSPAPYSFVFDTIVTIRAELSDNFCDSTEILYTHITSSLSGYDLEPSRMPVTLYDLVNEDTVFVTMIYTDIAPDYCSSNIDTIEYYFVISSNVPHVKRLSHIDNLDYYVTSCSEQLIEYFAFDADGIDTTNGIVLNFTNPPISFGRDMLELTCSDDLDSVYISLNHDFSSFDGDTITFELDSVFDIGGFYMGSPVRGEFVCDYSPPEFYDFYPPDGFTVNSESVYVSVDIIDDVCGYMPLDSFTINVYPEHSGILYDDLEFLISGLQDGDSIVLCAFAHDNCIDTCGEHYADSCISFGVVIGDINANIIEPIDLNRDGLITSGCTNQEIIFEIFHTEPVELSSIVLSVDGSEYTIANPELELSGDNIIFTPSEDYHADTISYCLESLCDNSGSCIEREICGEFIIDITPPIVFIETGASSGDTIYGDIATGSFSAIDEICSFSVIDSIRIETSESHIEHMSLDSTYWIGGLINDDIVNVCVYCSDNCHDYCENADSFFCFEFYVNIGGISANIEQPIEYGEADGVIISNCANQPIIWNIIDEYEIIDSSIIVNINGITYTLEDSLLELDGTRLLFNTPESFWEDSDTIRFFIEYIEDITFETADSIGYGEFYVDLSPPYAVSSEPSEGAISYADYATINALFDDNFCEDDFVDSCYAIAFDTLGMEHMSVGGTNFPLYIDELYNMDSVFVCAIVSDKCAEYPSWHTGYCETNCDTICWHFFAAFGTPWAELFAPPDTNGDYLRLSSCPSYGFIINIHDSIRVETDRIHFTVRYNRELEQHYGTSDLTDYYYIAPDSSSLQIRFIPDILPEHGDWVHIELDSVFNSAGQNIYEPVIDSFLVDTRAPNIEFTGDVVLSSILADYFEIGAYAFDSLDGRIFDTQQDSLVVTIDSEIDRYINRGDSWADTVITGLLDGDIVTVCAYCHDMLSDGFAGYDSVYSCDFNYADTCITLNVAIGSIFAETTTPVDIDGNGIIISSCREQSIVWQYSSLYEIVDTLVRVRISGDTFSVMDSELAITDSLIIFTPSAGYYRDSSVFEFALVHLEDSLGNTYHGSSMSEGSVLFDFSAPVIIEIIPAAGSYISSSETTIVIHAQDSSYRPIDCSRNYVLNMTAYIYESGSITESFSTSDSVLNIIGLDDADSVVCAVVLADNCFDYCESNIDTVHISYPVDLNAPGVELYEPSNLSFTSCEFQSISWVITGDVDITSVILEVESVLYGYSSPQLTYEDSILTWQSTTPWEHLQIVRGCINHLYDYAGNDIEPCCARFTADFLPPVMLEQYPPNDTVLTTTTPEINCFAIDSVSGMDFDNITASINGFEIVPSIVDSQIIISDGSIMLDDGSYNEICISTYDLALYCESNTLDTCWGFWVSVSGPQITLDEPALNSISACTDQYATFIAQDPDGLDESSLRAELRLNSEDFYSLDDSCTNIDDSLITVYPDIEYENGDTVEICVHINDILGNTEILSECALFIIDLEKPVINAITPFPDTVVYNLAPEITISIFDSISGISDVNLIINDEVVTHASTGYTISYTPSEDLPQNSFMNICLELADNPDYCEPNTLDSCWSVYLHGYPNLYPDNVQFIESDVITEGDTVLFNAYVYNDNIDSVGAFDVCLEISDILNNTIAIGAIAESESVLISEEYVLPEGEYEFCLIVDCDDVIIESDEDDNIVCSIVIVEGIECDAFPDPFTPNNDGIHEVIEFTFPDQVSKGAEILIFDIDGRLVRKITSTQSNIKRSWDGRDQNGKPMPRAPYIYSIEIDNKTVCKGTIHLLR